MPDAPGAALTKSIKKLYGMQQKVVALVGTTDPMGAPPLGAHVPGVTEMFEACRPITAVFAAGSVPQLPA